MTQKLATALFSLLLACVGGVGWWLQLRDDPQAYPASLSTLPPQIGAWQSSDLPMEPQIEEVLDADLNLQRGYVHPGGEIIWLYVGYYGTGRGGRPEHNPSGCYTGAGWDIEETRELEVEPGNGLRVNEYRVQRDGERRLVHFWYRSHRRTGMLGGLDQNIDRIIGRLFHGRADGALVRLSTPLRPDDEVGARSRLMSFAASIDPLIAERWPEERRSGDAT